MEKVEFIPLVYLCSEYFLSFKLLTNYDFYSLQLMDTNKDGVVTIEELVTWCSKDEQLLRSLDTLDTVL